MTHPLPLSEDLWVKPLEWREETSPREDGPAEPIGDWDADSPFGEYSVVFDDDDVNYGWCAWTPSESLGHFASIDDAKAAAQADYAARIISALSDLALTAIRANSGEGWQPIETAPRDGTWFWGWRETRHPEAGQDLWHWDSDAQTDSGRGFWINASDSNIDEYPSHWRPLPAPPIRSQHQEADQ